MLRRFGWKWIVAGAAALALAGGMAAPAAAQIRTTAMKFLKAVEDKDLQGATVMISEGGTTVVNSRQVGTNKTGLHVAVDRRDETWVNFLLQRGADPNLADRQGVTPLLLAVRLGFLPGVQALVDRGARVDESNQTGETPLISAVLRKDRQLVSILIGAGADPDRSDSTGRTARDYARAEGPQSPILAEVEKSNRSGSGNRNSGGGAYGPSF